MCVCMCVCVYTLSGRTIPLTAELSGWMLAVNQECKKVNIIMLVFAVLQFLNGPWDKKTGVKTPVISCSHAALIDLSLCCWATNWAFCIASWVSSSLMSRCHTALTVPPIWGNIRTWTPCPRAFTSSSSTAAIRSQNSAGLIWPSRRQILKMLVSTVLRSTWYRGGSHCNSATRDKVRDITSDSWKQNCGYLHKRRHLKW